MQSPPGETLATARPVGSGCYCFLDYELSNVLPWQQFSIPGKVSGAGWTILHGLKKKVLK